MPQITNKELMIEIKYLREAFEEFKDKICKDVDILKTDVQTLKDWKLTIVTKFATYATIGIFLGSFIATLILRYISHLLNW